MTPIDIPLVIFIVGLFTFALTVWKYIDSCIKAVRLESGAAASAASALASLARQELAEHRLHVSEAYVTKAGMQEQTNQIMRSIEAIGDKIDKVNERIDRVFESKTAAPRARS